MHRPPAQGPATQRRMFPGHTSHRGPGERTGINRYPRASSDIGKSPRITGVRQDNPLPPTSALQRHSSTLSPLWTNTPRAFSGQRPTQLNDKINTQVFPGHQPQLWPEGGGGRVSREVHSLFQAAKTHKADPPSPLPHAIARSQSEKALLPKQVALPGRGSVTGEVTPKHSQFIACRQGTGAGLGAGGSQRAAEGSEEAAGDKDGTVSLSSSHLASQGYAHLEGPSPSMDGEEPLHGGAGRAPGAPQPRWPHRSAPLGSAVGSELGASESPTSTEGRSPAQGTPLWGPRTKLMAQSGGRAATPLHIWLFGQLTWQGVGEQGKRDSGRGFI